jgi:Sec7-like guanine-nucleotide exchange factor
LAKFRLPGEAQKIDRIMEAFAKDYYTQNPQLTMFANSGLLFPLSFSFLFLFH